MSGIEPIVMPKWGLAMQEGLLASWHVEEGASLAKGQEIADIESSKIANVFESPTTGTLRRRVASAGETLPVGALLAVVAEASVADDAIDAFIAEFQASFVAEASSEAAKGPEPKYVDAGGRRLRYLEIGDAPGAPFLLVHGYGGDLNTWMFNQSDLAEQRRAIALDLPGHGGSTKEVGTGDPASLVSALIAFMEAMSIERAHYVGHSLGAALGLSLALDNPGRVASLTLISPAGLGPDISMTYIDGFISTTRARKLKEVLEMLVADPSMVTGDMVEEVLRYKRLDGADAALRTIAAAAFKDGKQTLQMHDRLGELGIPCQVIWGAEDQIVPAAHGNDLPAAVSLHLLQATGHLAHMEKAREVTSAILALAGR